MKPAVKRYGFFALCTAAAAAMAVPPVLDLLRNAHPNWYYTHIPVIPAISAVGLFWRVKRGVLPGALSTFWPGLLVMAAGLALFASGRPQPASLNAYAFLSASAALIFWWGAFLAAFGTRAFRNARFPLVFLVFAVPLPIIAIEGIIAALVAATTS